MAYCESRVPELSGSVEALVESFIEKVFLETGEMEVALQFCQINKKLERFNVNLFLT